MKFNAVAHAHENARKAIYQHELKAHAAQAKPAQTRVGGLDLPANGNGRV